ncbi:hypothetical protein D3C87_1284980 [compost metagenome]
MNRHEFDNLALTATDDVVAFAKFVQRTEFLFAGSSDADSLKCYQGAWFEVEIVNAAALAAWGDDGRPVKWDYEWRSLYQSSASEVITLLKDAARPFLTT